MIQPDSGNISYVYLLADSWSPISSNKYNLVINANHIATINSNDVLPLKLQKGVYKIGINNGSDFSHIKLDVFQDYFFLRISSEPGWEQSPLQFFPKPKISRISNTSMGVNLIQSKNVRSVMDITHTIKSLKSSAIKLTSKINKQNIILDNDEKSNSKYYALLIGNNNYHHLPNSKSAINDANALGKLLQDDFGFNITIINNATRKDIIDGIVKYRDILTHEDNFLLFYAGHGWLDSEADEGYWLPVNATKNSEADWVSNSTITSQIKAFDANHVMIISDSCYSGKLTRGISLTIKKYTSNRQKLIHRMREKKARTVMTSGGLEPVLDSGINVNQSVFMDALLSSLKEADGHVLGNELFLDVRNKVIVHADQNPEYADIRKAGHNGGDFIFIRQ